MLISNHLYAVWCALSLTLGTVASPLEPAVHVRTPPGTSEDAVVQAIRRELAVAAVQKRDREYKVNTTLDRSWDGAVLLSFGAAQNIAKANLSVSESVEIVCTTCYIKGLATGELVFADTFNASQVISNSITEVEGTVKNFTREAKEYFEDWMEGLPADFGEGIHLADFELPTWPYDFTVPISPIPKASLHFGFDGMELYMLIDTTLSLGATYTLPLYESESLAGIALPNGLDIGIIFSVDLILTVDGMIDISSGFHLKLEDGLAIDIALFDDEVSGITFNGGHFEFLPVTIESAGVVFTAVLRVGIQAGMNLVTPTIPSFHFDNHTTPSLGFSGGIEVAVFANVAEFVTNVTAQPDNWYCKLGVVQSYQLALGAAAGATIAVESYTWGPVAQTSVPIWYTQLDSGCVGTNIIAVATAMPNVTARAEKRQDLSSLTTTTLTTKITYTGVKCLSTGLVNCPVSLQNTSQSTATSTLVTVIPSGSDATFPASAQNAVPTTMTFGKNVVHLPATAGSPISYVPPPPTATATATNGPTTLLHNEVKGVSNQVIIGVSVGLGVPIVLALIAAMILMQKKRQRYAVVPRGEVAAMVAEPYVRDDALAAYSDKPGKTGITITEMQRRGS